MNLKRIAVFNIFQVKYLLAIFVLLAPALSPAQVLYINAKYAANNLKYPGLALQQSGYCRFFNGIGGDKYQTCYSFMSPGDFGPIEPSARTVFRVQIPSGWFPMDLVNDKGDVLRVNSRMSSIGGVYDDPSNTKWSDEHGGDFKTSIGNGTQGGMICRNTHAYPGAGRRGIPFLFNFPESFAICAMINSEHIGYSIYGIVFGLQFAVLERQDVPSGIFRGTRVLTRGVNGSTDRLYNMGPLMGSNDIAETITIHLSVEVAHILRVHLAQGLIRLVLVPEGGWQQWLSRGRRPERLTANQSFQISSLGSFQMRLECEHVVGDRCGIRNSVGHTVPVDTSVTLPSEVRSDDGNSVNRYRLNTDKSVFHPKTYVQGRNASLHFEIGRDGVKDMTEHAGKRYVGNITVIWEPEL